MALDVVVTFPQSGVSGFTVERYVIDDAMGELFQVELVVTSPDAALDMKTVVGETVVLDFPSQPFLPRIQGMVRRAEQQTCEPSGLSRYALWVVPPLWLLSKRVDRRIFQQLPTTEIVQAVLKTFGGRVPDAVLGLIGVEMVREYCTQYGETDLDFVFRLLSEDGLASCFDHANDSAWLLMDDSTILSAAPDVHLPWVPTHLTPTGPACLGVSLGASITESRVVLAGHNYERPNLAIRAESASPASALFHNQADLEDYGFDVALGATGSDADARARYRMERAALGLRSVHAELNVAMPVGAGLVVDDHPACSKPMRVLRLRSEVDATTLGQTKEWHQVEVGSQTLPFRPKMRSRPRIAGTQTARVVGSPGEVIDVDNLGRVVVEHRWDRRGLGAMGGTSRRVRVACPWAGPQRGLFGVPRVGDEVVVSYLDGDPDEPLIVGSVHDAVRTTPQHLPSEKTVTAWRSSSTPGGDGYNEIKMDDAAGAELLAVRAERDYRLVVNRNSEVVVTGERVTTVNETETNIVKGARHEKVGGAYTLEAKGALNLASDAAVMVSAHKIELHAGAAKITMAYGEILIEADRVTVRGKPIDLNP